jgi:hypothetical protein
LAAELSKDRIGGGQGGFALAPQPASSATPMSAALFMSVHTRSGRREVPEPTPQLKPAQARTRFRYLETVKRDHLDGCDVAHDIAIGTLGNFALTRRIEWCR